MSWHAIDMAILSRPSSIAAPCTCGQGRSIQFYWQIRGYRALSTAKARWQGNHAHQHKLEARRSIGCSGTAGESTQSAISVEALPCSATEKGQQAFDRAEYEEALQLFSRAMTLRPNEDEARAALYNGACVKVKLKNWQGAADDVLRAVNEYKLKLEVAVKVHNLPSLCLIWPCQTDESWWHEAMLSLLCAACMAPSPVPPCGARFPLLRFPTPAMNVSETWIAGVRW